MGRRRVDVLIGGAVAASLFSLPASAAKTTVSLRIAVTPTFAATLQDVIDAFTFAANTDPANSVYTYSITTDVDSDPDIAAAIVAGDYPDDLFLSVSGYFINPLAAAQPKLVYGTFFYAGDTLALFAGGENAVDVTGGLGKALSALKQPFSMTDGSLHDPYATPAAETLNKVGWNYNVGLRKGQVILQPDAGASLAYANYLGGSFAFTGKSQICDARSGQEEFAGDNYYLFKPGADYRSVIKLAGAKILRNRTPDQEKALDKFVTFLTGQKPIVWGGISYTGTTAVKDHCYTASPFP